MTELAVKRPASRRRLVLRILLVVAVALMASLTTALIWLALAYHHFAGDLRSSRERVPDAVSAALVPRGNILDEPQITLAIASGGNEGTAPVAFRSDPGRRVIAFLSLPTITRDTSDAEVVETAGDMLRADINHVLIVSPRRLGSIVDAVGTITVENAHPVDYILVDGTYLHFPSGTIELDGRRAVRFMLGTSSTTTSVRQQLVLEGIISSLLAPTTVSELAKVTRAISTSTDADFTPSEVLGLAWLRFRSKTLLYCRLTDPGELRVAVTSAELRTFLGRGAGVGRESGCESTRLSASPIPLPPKALVKAVGTVYPHLWSIALWVLTATAVLVAILVVVRSGVWRKVVPATSPHRGVPAPSPSIRAQGRFTPRDWGGGRNGFVIVLYAVVIAGSAGLVLLLLTLMYPSA